MYMHVAGVIHSLAWTPQLMKNSFFETDFWDWIYDKKAKSFCKMRLQESAMIYK